MVVGLALISTRQFCQEILAEVKTCQAKGTWVEVKEN